MKTELETGTDDLAARLEAVVTAWEAGQGASPLPATRSMQIAEALQAVTWARPLSHACLTLLLDEERHAALAGYHLKGGTA